jgi:hypothetical protein
METLLWIRAGVIREKIFVQRQTYQRTLDFLATSVWNMHSTQSLGKPARPFPFGAPYKQHEQFRYASICRR